MIHQGFSPCKQKDILPFLDIIQQNLKTTCEKVLGHGHKLPMPHSFCLFVANFGGLWAVPTEPPYCLVYPTEFTANTPQAARDHRHPQNTLPALCTREYVCRHTIHHANMASDNYTEYTGSHLLILWGAQYPKDGIPQLVKPQNHHGPLIDPKDGKAYPMHSVGNFSLDDALFPSVPGDSFLYAGVVHDELEQQGFDILTYVDTSLRVMSISVPVSASSKPLTAPSQDITIALAQAPDSIILAHSPKLTAKHAGSSKTDSPQRKSKA